MPDQGPGFDAAVPPGGYGWWYVDALSDDGRFGLTLIAFIGSVFSPYYAWSGWKDPLNHCAVNVALYREAGKRWAMTERGREALRRDATHLSIGPSALDWDGETLTIRIDEITAPLPTRLRGTVRLRPGAVLGQRYALDAAGRHQWRPIAPRARVEVAFDQPACAWTGDGYFDTNAGDEPLDRGFTRWDWARAHLPTDTLLFYDVERRGGERAYLAMRIDAAGVAHPVEPPARQALPLTVWRVPRHARSEAQTPPETIEILEDTPFYARSILDARYGGEPARMVHESLSADRLRSPIVRAMLPFRMPRTLFRSRRG